MRPAFMVLSILLLFGCKEEAKQNETSAIRAVYAATIAWSVPSVDVVYTGTVEARHTTVMAFQVGGRIETRPVDIGQIVRKGDLLSRIDTVDLELEVRSAQANVAALEAELTEARLALARQAQLVQRAVSAQAVLDTALAKEMALGEVLDQARARLALAQNALGYAELLSRRDALVTEIFAEAGQVVSTGQPIAKLAGLDEREVVVDVPEARLDFVKGTTLVQARFWTESGFQNSINATLREIAAQADVRTRTYRVKLRLIDPPDSLRLGATATVRFTQPGAKKVARLPLSALFQDSEGAAVWVLDPGIGQAFLMAVKVAEYGDDYVLLSEGPPGGALVATAGVHLLTPEMQVTPRPDPRTVLAVGAM